MSRPPGGTVRDGVVAAAVAAAATVVALLGRSWCGTPGSARDQYLRWCYTDVVPLYSVHRLDVGAVPYLDQPVEYPPLTGLWMWLAGLPADSPGTFLLWTGVLLVVSAAVTGWLLGREVGLRRALVFAAAPTLLVSGAVNWDLPSVALATAGLVLHRRGRGRGASAALGLGAAAKAWPALLVPAVALDVVHRDGWREALRFVGRSAGWWAAVNVPVALVAPDAWARFLELSRERAVDWDSLWRVVPQRLGADVPAAGSANTLVTVVTLVGLAGLLLVAWRRGPDGRRHLVALPFVAWFLLAGKVWSPQFTLWLLPLLALAAPTWPMLAALGVTDVAVTVTRFPYLGGFVGAGLPEPDGTAFEVAVLARAVVVAWVGLAAWTRATGAPPDGGRDRRDAQTARVAERSSQ